MTCASFPKLKDLKTIGFLWSSERNGYRHLYQYEKDGTLLRQLTEGDWPVDRVTGVVDRRIYFLAGKESPLERHTYRIDLDGGSPSRSPALPGIHTSMTCTSGRLLADLHDAADRARGSISARRTAELIRTVYENGNDEAERLGLAPPQFLTV